VEKDDELMEEKSESNVEVLSGWWGEADD